MEHVTRALNYWLAKNNIPTEGVRIVIEFPEERHAHAAEMCIKRDLEPTLQYVSGTFGKMDTMHGIGLTLRARG